VIPPPQAAPVSFKQIAARRRLAVIMLIFGVLYLAFDVYMFVSRGLFIFIGVDYRSFWTSAFIAHTQGFVPVYNLDLGVQGQIQEWLVDTFRNPDREKEWAIVPTPYLPIFVALIQPFLIFPPGPGWAVWTLVNVVATEGYLIWFWRQMGGRRERSVLLAMCLSFPALETFQFGQVNGWLLIFMGEFFRHQLLGHDLRSGLWLSGLLLKPQTLMVIGPGLLIAQRWRTLAGATAGGIAILVASLAVAGLDGFMEDVRLVLLYSGNVASTVPRDMMNWRSLAFHLSDASLPNVIAWGIPMAGLAVTYLAGLALWVRARDASGPRFGTIMLGSYAATCAVAWHSHTHMGLPMAIPLLYLSARGEVSYRTLAVWLVTPYLVFAILRVVFDLGHVGVLAVNLYLLAWALAKVEVWPLARRVRRSG
jgi:hypothetical protein